MQKLEFLELFSQALWQYFLLDALCSLGKMIDFQARPISLLAFLFITYFDQFTFLNFFLNK